GPALRIRCTGSRGIRVHRFRHQLAADAAPAGARGSLRTRLSSGSKAMSKNIEVKARCADLVAARRAARQIGARQQGLLLQTDTYFNVRRGRLKLREIRGERAELIWYQRPNRAAARDSDYVIVPVADPA